MSDKWLITVDALEKGDFFSTRDELGGPEGLITRSSSGSTTGNSKMPRRLLPKRCRVPACLAGPRPPRT
jgi:hypothetical protein